MTDPYDFGTPVEGEPPLFIEPIHGVRAFGLDKLGRLTPWAMTECGPWLPGENVSMHSGFMPEDFLFASLLATPAERERQIKARQEHGPHTCPHCGFYAYTDQQSAAENHVRRFKVAGIIEAYGKVVQGPLGFRAQKAKIVALHVPGLPLWAMKALDRTRPWMLLVIVALTFLVAALGAPTLRISGFAAFGPGTFAGIALAWLVLMRVRGVNRLGTPALRARMAVYDNYPDVKFYRRRSAMMKHYGIRKTPDLPPPTTEEFWTRRVS